MIDKLVDRLTGVKYAQIVLSPVRKYNLAAWQVVALLELAGKLMHKGVSFEALYLAMSRDAEKYDHPSPLLSRYRAPRLYII